MSNLIIDIENIATNFGTWITKEFNAAHDLYNTLTEEEKKAATWSYGLIAIVNQNIDKDAVAIIPILQLKYPDLSLDVIHGFIDNLLNDAKVIQSKVPVTLEDALNELVGYLKTLHGSVWEQISQAFGNILAVAFSPETPIQKFIGVAEIVYQAIVKPHVASA